MAKAVKVTHTTMDIESALKFINAYHPEILGRVDEGTLDDIITICHAVFVTHRKLLAVNDGTHPITQ
jgi:hypothetical protein